MDNNKIKVIETACQLAEGGFLNPCEMPSMMKELKKNGIDEKDFVSILSENPNEGILSKVKKWIPRSVFSNDEYEEIKKREDWKLSVLKKYLEAQKEDGEVKRKLRVGYFYSWEFLEKSI